jgi:hypothetical protein
MMSKKSRRRGACAGEGKKGGRDVAFCTHMGWGVDGM